MKLGHIRDTRVLLSILGFVITVALLAWRVRGAHPARDRGDGDRRAFAGLAETPAAIVAASRSPGTTASRRSPSTSTSAASSESPFLPVLLTLFLMSFLRHARNARRGRRRGGGDAGRERPPPPDGAADARRRRHLRLHAPSSEPRPAGPTSSRRPVSAKEPGPDSPRSSRDCCSSRRSSSSPAPAAAAAHLCLPGRR